MIGAAHQPPKVNWSATASGAGWELRRADCLRSKLHGLASIPDGIVDHIITDPPYDEHTHTKSRTGHTDRPERPQKQASFNRSREPGFVHLTSKDMDALAVHFARITRRWIAVFCAIEMIGDSAKLGGKGWRAALERAGLQYVRTCVWHKLGSTPQFSGDRPAIAVECIVLAHHKGRKKWNSRGKHGYYAYPIVLDRGNGADRVHTTQKPLGLMREIVEDFTLAGELICDPFAGSGTTGIACRMGGRRFLGWERDRKYHLIAARRIAGEEVRPRREQLSLPWHQPTVAMAEAAHAAAAP